MRPPSSVQRSSTSSRRTPTHGLDPALERRLLSDPDPEIAVAALEVLRQRATQPLLDHWIGGLRWSRTAGDPSSSNCSRRSRNDGRPSSVAVCFQRSCSSLPRCLLQFRPAGQCACWRSAISATVARRRSRSLPRCSRINRQRFDFAVTLGDNFYSTGMASPDDPRWKTWWSDLYDPLRIPFYATLGNHDWGQPNSPAAEIIFTQHSLSWRMPAAYYTYTAGDAQFFALDTDIISEKQLLWLKDALQASTARWKIVYGHHPIYSEGAARRQQHEDCPAPAVAPQSRRHLPGRPRSRHATPQTRRSACISSLPDRAASCDPLTPGPRSLFAKSANGFAVLEVQKESLAVAFVDVSGEELYRYRITTAATP